MIVNGSHTEVEMEPKKRKKRNNGRHVSYVCARVCDSMRVVSDWNGRTGGAHTHSTHKGPAHWHQCDMLGMPTHQ